MRLCRTNLLVAAALVASSLLSTSAVSAEDVFYEIAEGAYSMPVPAGWTKKQPRVRIIEAEFEAKAAEGDELPGRATVMGAGGSIEDNINRWCGQFIQPDGTSTREKAKVRNTTSGGCDVVIVDVTGTYEDKPGPFVPGKGVERPNYRMIAAIIQTKKAGNYFVKFYGPAKTVAMHEANFNKMIEGLKLK